MIILSHRGWWTAGDANTEPAFRRSFDGGFGVETDVRDAAGALVIAHDPPRGGEFTLDALLKLPGAARLPLALNIKADGLATRLRAAALANELTDYFVFDMSVPDMRAHLAAGNPVFTRMSEAEPAPVWIDRAAGVWLDAFESDWYDATLLRELLDRRKKRVCVVSPELHGRSRDAVWTMLDAFRSHDRLSLCTDAPGEAARCFA